MSFVKIPIFALLAAVVTLSLIGNAAAQDDDHCATPRQYYSEWKKHPTQDYHYRKYYYKPSAKYSGYKHHYVIYSPKKPDNYYYYNNYKKKYWGRCPVKNYGKPMYSHLQPDHQKATLAEIPEAHFPEFSGLPPIPESSDGQLLDLPPDDLPIVGPEDF